ncbi:glutamyl-trna amidotransferase, partial [Thalassiosira pseudonana CCMP1335]
VYQTIIGIEIHAQLSIPTKLFSSAPTRHNPSFGVNATHPANTLVHAYDIAYPGTLPSLSQSAVKASVLSAAALGCTVHRESRFERKHYFYPDLPLGYQITQQQWPLASDGLVTFEPYSNSQMQLRIERIQIEQDTGKTTNHSYIDYNRAGCALIEIVSHPDLRSAHEAAGVVEKIRKLLKHVGSCDGRMEEGSLRCDLNEELPPDTGHRVEVKNLNSLRQIIAATEYEALRQSSLAMVDDPTGRETRTFHVKPISDRYPLGGETICIRSKGDAIDYRFMPEPDLPPLILDEETLGCERGLSLLNYIEYIMPESQEEAAARLVKDYGLSEDVANVITGDPAAIAMLEETMDAAPTHIDDWTIPTMAANWLSNDVFALVKKTSNALNHPISVEYSTVDGSRLGCLIAMIINGTLTSSMAKKILTIMYKEDLDSSPLDIANANGWRVISDMTTLLELCERVVLDPKNSKQLEQYKQGGKIWKIEKFFVGKIMGASQGNAHPERMKEAL